jgi:hypothetical protein
MIDEKTLNLLAVFASGYAKRWMESNYDRLMRTAVGEKLSSLGPIQKHAIEAGLYALMAFADQKLKADTPLKKFLTEVVKDAPPEIAKRLINGAKGELKADAEHLQSLEEKLAVQTLLELDVQTLTSLLEWLANSDSQERHEIAARLQNFSREEIEKLAKLSPLHRSTLMDLARRGSGAAKRSGSFVSSLSAQIDKWTAGLERKRESLRPTRKDST